MNNDNSTNNKDYTLLFRRITFGQGGVNIDEEAADINRDGKVNNKDVNLLFRYLVGLDIEIADIEEPVPQIKIGDTPLGEFSVVISPSAANVVKNAAIPLGNVDKITMYGDGNSAKLVKDIMGTVVQVTDGMKESTGVDLSAVLAGFLGGKAAGATTNAKSES